MKKLTESKLPKGYPRNVSRVSNIVSFKFPFKGTNAEDRYLKWLKSNKIEELNYYKEATSVGTFIHLQLEKYILGEEQDVSHKYYDLHNIEIEQGKKYIRDLFIMNGELIPEKIVIDKQDRFAGTIDLVRIDEENKTVYLYDYKTYGIAKKKWELPHNNKKPYAKLKKVALQLSLYAETYRQKGYEIGGIYVVWLHEKGMGLYGLDLWTTDEIDELLEEIEESLLEALPNEYTLDINYKTMQVRINTNIKGKAYTNAEIVLEGTDCEGKTPEEKIEEAIRLQKILLSKY